MAVPAHVREFVECVRLRRTEIVESFAHGEITIRDLVASARQSRELSDLYLVSVLEKSPLGKVRSRRLLADLNISPTTAVGIINDSQIARLEERLISEADNHRGSAE